MPRKVDPRRGEIVPQSTPDFWLEDTDAKKLAEFLGVFDDKEIEKFKADVEYIGQTLLDRRAQDEDGPSRAERNEALRQLAEAEDFIGTLGTLNHRAESALMDALYLYSDSTWTAVLNVNGAFSLIEKVKYAGSDIDLDTAIDHMRKAIQEHLPRLQKQRGPDYGINFSLAVDDLLDLYFKVTGQVPTHSVFYRDNNAEDLNSRAGRFVQMVFGQINRTLKENKLPGIPSTRVFTEVRRAVRRFKEP